MTRRSKSEFYVLLIIDWNYIILEMFSSSFMLSAQHLQPTKFQRHIFSIVSTRHICHSSHICQMNEKNCCLKRIVKCRKHMTNCLFKGTLMRIWKISLNGCVYTKAIPWKFRTLIPKNSRVTFPWSL